MCLVRSREPAIMKDVEAGHVIRERREQTLNSHCHLLRRAVLNKRLGPMLALVAEMQKGREITRSKSGMGPDTATKAEASPPRSHARPPNPNFEDQP